MSNNPPLPPPDMDDFEATMIREQNPLPELPPDMSGFKMTTIREGAKPRRAKERNPIWGYLALGGYFFLAGLLGCIAGLLLYELS